MADFLCSVVDMYSPDEFKMHFRMTRSTSEAIYEHISAELVVENEPILCDNIPGNEKQYVIL